VGGTRYHGHWLQIKLPYAITLSHSNVHPTNTILDRPPKDGVILGSNDGENWYKLTEFSGKTYTASTWTRIDVNATTPYQYFRMCATKNGGDSKLELTEWRLFAEKPVTRMENVHISGELSSETLQTGYIKWPKVPLKANESEGYVVSQSSSFNSNFIGFHAFEDKSEYTDGGTPSWASGSTSFSSGSAAVSRTTGSDTFYHEWLQIQLPQSIQLSYFNIIRRDVDNNKLNEAPKNGFMYGSNDGIAWTKLVSYSDLTYTDYTPTRVDVNSTNSYKYFRLAVTNTTYTSGAVAYTAINELQLFEAATGVGAAPTSAKLQVAGSLGMAKGAEFFAGDDVVMELPKHDRPLVKYPEVKMTANSSGGYVASATSEFSSSYGAWRAFNGVYDDDGQVDSWQPTGGEKYSTANGTWIGGTGSPYAIALTTGTTIYGEWLQLQIPSKIKLKYMNFSPIHISSGTYDNLGPHRSPREGYILGSNDGTNWTPLKNWTGLDYSYWNQYERSFGKIDVNDTNYYKYFRLVWTRTVGGTYAGYASAQEVEYYGTEEGDESVDVVHRSIPNKPSQQHLAVYWDANDSNSYSFADSSNVYDLSGNGVTATISGANGFNAKYNSWILNNNLVDYISSTLSHDTGAWMHSVSTWMYRYSTTSTNQQNVFQFGTTTTSAGCAARFEWISNQWMIRYYFMGNDVIFYLPGHAKSFENWIHITATYDGGSDSGVANGSYGLARKLYVNGVPCEVQSSSSPGSLNLGTTSSTFYLGHRPSAGSLIGEVANARVYSKALSAEQVRELYEYDAPRFGHRQNLVALHKGNLGVGVAHPTSRFEVAGADGLQEYPPKAMSDFETYMEGHGVFRASADSWSGSSGNILLYRPWKAFIKGTSESASTGDNSWLDSSGDFNSVSGVYEGSVLHHNGSVSGEYLQLELPYEIKLSSYSLAPWNYPTGGDFQYADFPRDFIIYGSKDYTNWDVLDTRSGQSSTSQSDIKTYNINSLKTYKYFTIVITKINTATYPVSAIYAAIGEWRLFGTPAPSSLEDGHLTLGKALTLPRVSGHAAGAETPRAASLVVHYDTTVDSVVAGSTVVDISGEGANGTLNGNATYSSTDRALTFDGTGDYVSGTIPTTTGAWVHSVSLWTKVNESDTFGALFLIGSLSEDNCSASRWNGANVNQLFHFFYDNDFLYEVQKTPNTWMHLLFTYDGGSAVSSRKLYVNGVQARVISSSTGTPLNLVTTSTPLYFGAMPANPYDGSISNIKIWDVALTAEEVAAEYALGRTGKSINLTDTSLCLGGTVPRAQLDVRGAARFETMNVDGNVGIGTASPKALAHVGKLSANSGTFNDIPQSNMGISATFPDSTRLWLSNRLEATGEDYWGMALGTKYTGDMYIQSVNKASNAIYDLLLQPNGGKVGIGTTNPGGKLHVSGDLNLGSSSNYLFRPSVYWYQTYGSTSGYARAYMEVNNTWTLNVNGYDKMYIRPDAGVVLNDFTGQHRCFVDGVHSGNIDDYVGLIVCANKNAFTSASFNVYKGNRAIQMDETLPDVSLSKVARDKSCFGVISHIEDEEKREDTYGSITIPVPKEVGDTRVYINSVGEGAMWVVNSNGSLESGDYITTSNVAGYGQRQDDDILHNYTVAKITMDCDFNPPDIPVQRILKELANVTYWYQLEDATSNAYDRTQEETYWAVNRYTEVPGRVDEQSNVFVSPDHDLELYTKTRVNVITAEVWEALPEGERAYYSETDANTFAYTQTIQISPETWDDLSPEEQNTYVHGYYDLVVDEVPPETSGATQRTRTVYKNVVNETTEEPENPEDYLTEVRQEWVNVLDEHGQLQWEDVPWGATEKAYNIRYLDANGGLTTRHNAVHTAAFVGVTYHCG
jgi:hypothetical protein